MRAVAVRRFRASPELMDLPVPRPASGELLVRLEFAGMNPYDAKIADGILEGHRPHVFPLVLGVDAEGVVEAVGPEVHRFRPGDRVVGQFLHDPVGTGTYADLAVVPERIGIVPTPSTMPAPEAAALPTAGMTALAAIDALDLPAEGTLMIVGASGGVGSYATEIASARGIRVTAVARSNSSERLQSLGAAEVVDLTALDDPAGAVGSPTRAYDGLLDAMSDAAALARHATRVRRGGVVVSTVYAADVVALARLGMRSVNLDLQPDAQLMGRLVREVLDHRLKVPVERRVRLEDSPAALADLKAGRGRGKTVVELRP